MLNLMTLRDAVFFGILYLVNRQHIQIDDIGKQINGNDRCRTDK